MAIDESEDLRTRSTVFCIQSMDPVYGTLVAVAVSRVLACLLEKHVEFDVTPVDIFKSEQKLPESLAICRYVCEKYSNKGNRGLYGLNQLEKASIDQWLEAEGQSFHPPIISLIYQLAISPRMNLDPDEELIKQNEEKLSKVLDVYDERLGESRFLAGDEFSLGDLSHLPNTHYLINLPTKELFTSLKNVKRWLGEISVRESWKKVVEIQKKQSSS